MPLHFAFHNEKISLCKLEKIFLVRGKCIPLLWKTFLIIMVTFSCVYDDKYIRGLGSLSVCWWQPLSGCSGTAGFFLSLIAQRKLMNSIKPSRIHFSCRNTEILDHINSKHLSPREHLSTQRENVRFNVNSHLVFHIEKVFQLIQNYFC